MKLAIQIDTQGAIAAGKNHAGVRVIDIDPADLNEAERGMLARKVATLTARGEFRDTRADAYLVYAPGATLLIEATVGDLRRVLGEAIAQEAREAAERAERAAAELARNAAEDARLAALPASELVRQNYPADPWRVIHEVERPGSYPLAAARLAEAEAERDRRNAERDLQIAAEKAAREAAEKAQAARVAAAKESLADWTRKHGGELARLRLEAGYDCWLSAARSDYVDAVVARIAEGLTPAADMEGYDFEQDDRKCPTLSELKALAAAGARIKSDPDAGAAVTLQRLTYTPEEPGRDGDDGKVVRTELEVEVIVFGEWGESRYYLIPE